MIQVDNLSISFQGNSLFKEATFSLQEGERCALVGRNGSGKTTLFKILSKMEEPDSGQITTRKNYKVGTLSQHITFSFNTLIEEAASALSKEDQDNLYKAEKILFGLGFKEEDLEKSPLDFSGGYQIRIHLAKLLITEPNCLLLDEPTNYLDILSVRWFTKFLRQWKGEFVLISHDREFLDSVSTHTMGIHRQKIKKVKGSTVDFYEQLFQEEEIYEKTRVNLEKKKEHVQKFIDRFGAKASKATQAQSKQKQLERIPTLEKLKDLYHLSFNFKEVPFNGKKMLEAQDLSFDYLKDASDSLIQNFSLEVEKGKRIAIIGKNGRGKSTLLKLLMQELSPLSGHVKKSENVYIGYFGQTNIDRLHKDHTIEEEIANANTQLNRTEVKGICGLMMFSSSKSEKQIKVLSGGEKARVLLGKIIASPCNLLLLDEPTHHLDMESIEALIDALEEFTGTLILVTHSELILKRLQLDHIVICSHHTQEHFTGTYEEFLEKKGWDDEGSKEKKVNTFKKEKQQRAETIQERSKLLKPIEDKILKIEKAITDIDAFLQKEHLLIAEYAKNGKKDALQESSKAVAAKTKEQNQLYDELDKLLQQKDTIF